MAVGKDVNIPVGPSSFEVIQELFGYRRFVRFSDAILTTLGVNDRRSAISSFRSALASRTPELGSTLASAHHVEP
jgi:hypothetical protein